MSALTVITPAVSPAVSAAVSFGVTIALTPLLIALSIRFRIFDPPGPLKIHSRPVSRIGGAALMLGFLAGVLASGQRLPDLFGFAFLALVMLWLVGFLDDLFELPVIVRFGVQIAAALLLWLAGWRLPVADSGWISCLALTFFCLVFVNAFNFLDGADGLAPSVALAIALGFSAAFCRISGPPSPGPAIAAGVAGACAAFLAFNFPPARIFLGDSGSTLLGFVFALLSLEFYRTAGAGLIDDPGLSLLSARHATTAIFFPVLVSLLPLLDFGFAVFRRLRLGASPFAGDRRHFYDLLLARGWAARHMAVGCAGITVALAALGCMALRMDWNEAAGLFFWTVALLGMAAGWLGAARSEDREVRGSGARQPR
ncbi:MAG TPA: MraY family glycosyltransferase [Verrucomicrobiae bacterium]|nr:MraY family glycosyltransferase [Verrucomicrobiae bacterium]